MQRLWQSESSFLVAALAALALTPLAWRLAHRIGALDQPEARRVHRHPIPLCGGLAMLAAFWLGVGAAALVDTRFLTRPTWGILLGATAISVMGLADDIRSLPVSLRLLVQVIVAAAVAWGFDVQIAVLTRYGGDGPYIYLQWLAVPASVVWIVAITNAFNWIDGLDGLAAGIAALAGITLLLMAAANPGLGGSLVVVVLAGALAGAATGFLRYNFSPAWIFMGDSGSMFLGFVLACVALVGAFKKATLGILVPPLAFAVPIYDAVSTMWIRWRSGQPVHAADRRNVHHRLLDRGLSPQRVVYLLYAATAVCCVVALIFVV
ncbi:MAG: MraY family glycosyltransferase [Armatimonadota bacterium]